MTISQLNKWVAVGAGILLVGGFLAWFFFFRSTAVVSTNTTTSTNSFGNVPNNSNTTSATTDTNGSQTINTTPTAQQKIFKISDGPIVGATLIQMTRPTTTVARYIRQDDGHVFDVPLGVSGAIPRIVSNVTIPGGERAIWLEGGNAALLQYVDDASVVKTVYLGFPQATTSGATLPTRIQFLPDNLVDVAASPDGTSVVYLIKTSNGADGYIANSSGINSRKVFSLPLSQLLLSWPATSTILVQTTSAAGVQGIAFSVSTKTGSVSQLLAAQGLSVAANKNFSLVIYQVATQDATKPLSYIHSVQTGTDSRVAFNPIPEKCIWSSSSTISMYCASPLQSTPLNYLDLWHQGAAGLGDSIYAYDMTTNVGRIFAIPGSTDGGVTSDIFEMALSPDEHYLSFTTKGARALWGVTLAK